MKECVSSYFSSAYTFSAEIVLEYVNEKKSYRHIFPFSIFGRTAVSSWNSYLHVNLKQTSLIVYNSHHEQSDFLKLSTTLKTCAPRIGFR